MSSPFKAYDIRGKFPAFLSPELAYALGQALIEVFKPRSCVIGMDARLSGDPLQKSLLSALQKANITITLLGQCGTEEIYNAASTGNYDLGIMITGSHNPADENGFKLVRRGAIPIGHDSGLQEVEEKTLQFLAQNKNNSFASNDVANIQQISKQASHSKTNEKDAQELRENFLQWLINYSGINDGTNKKLRILADAGNGCAGLLLDPLSKMLNHEIIPSNWEPDGTFPHGVPNPLLPNKRARTSQAVMEANADLGVSFDGDFDRCFFYDSEGNFIESYYLVGLLASVLLKKHPGEKIIHDPRVYWNTQEVVKKAGGIPIMGKTGHAYMKEKMRKENALYGGEMSAHHYFRDFSFCDSGMLTMLLLIAFLQNSKDPLTAILNERMQAFPCSGEINFKTPGAKEIMDIIKQKYEPAAQKIDMLDGINLEMANWRFNLRTSNTEPLLRLNLETRTDKNLLKDKMEEIMDIIRLNGGELVE